MNTKASNRIRKILANVYLYLAYIVIFYNFISHLRFNCPISIFIIIMETLGYLISYILINHLLVKKVISHKILMTMEIILFVSLFLVLFNGAVYYASYHLFNDVV